jgi:uncharacterized protein
MLIRMLQNLDHRIPLRHRGAVDEILQRRKRQDEDAHDSDERNEIADIERDGPVENLAEPERAKLHRAAIQAGARKNPVKVALMLVGTLSSLWRFPVKSGPAERLEEVAVDASGLCGDRTSAYFVTSPGLARTGKTYRGKENDRLHLAHDEVAVYDLAARDSVRLGRRDGARFVDAAPVSLLLDRWMEELAARVGYAVEPIRFRPNLFVRAVAEFQGNEAVLEGRTLHVGSVALTVRCPIERCVVTTYDPAGGASDPRILRYIARERNALMGVYCDVVTPGVVRIGDAVCAD